MQKTNLSLGPRRPYDVGDDDNQESPSLVLEAWFEVDNIVNDLSMLTRLAKQINPACNSSLAEAVTCVRLAQGNLLVLEEKDARLIPASQHPVRFRWMDGWYEDGCEDSENSEDSENPKAAEDRLKKSLQGLSDTVFLCLKASKALGVSVKDSPAIESALYKLADAKFDSTASQETVEGIRKSLVELVLILNSKLAEYDFATPGIANDLGAEGTSSTLDMSSINCSTAALHAVALMLADAKACYWDAIITPPDADNIWASMLPCLSKVKAVHTVLTSLQKLALTPLAATVERVYLRGGDVHEVMTALCAFTSLKSFTSSSAINWNNTIYRKGLPTAPASLEHVRLSFVNELYVLKELFRAFAHVKTLTLSLDTADVASTERDKPAAFLDALLDHSSSASTTTVHVDKLTVGASSSSPHLLQRIAKELPGLQSMEFFLEEEREDRLSTLGMSLKDICEALRTLPPGLREVEIRGRGCEVTEEHRDAVRSALEKLKRSGIQVV